MLTKEKLNELILSVRKGNSSAFEELYDAYSAALFGIAKKILKDPQIAEDSVHDAFIKIWKKIHTYDIEKGSFFTWILNINRNTAIDKYRKLAKTTLIPIQTSENFVDSGKRKHDTQKTDHIGVKDLISVLPEKEQIILEYIYFKGFTQKETAEELDLPLGTVKTRSRSALKNLKELFSLLATWI